MGAIMQCPHCKQQYGLNDEQVSTYMGQTITCTQCQQAFTVSADLIEQGYSQISEPAAWPTSLDQPLKLVTVCRMGVMEAELVKARLAGERIESIVRDSRMAVTHPLIVSDVPVLVREEDVARARQILVQPVEDDGDGEYVDENWRCPKCHRRGVDLLPMVGGWRVAKYVCIALWTAPLVAGIGSWLLEQPPQHLTSSLDEHTGDFICGWTVTVIVLTLAVVFAPRKKRCQSCGFEWAHRMRERENE
jgi:predicted Zn finger-like uncharacterized protein